MNTRLVGCWAVAALLAAGSAWAVEPDSADEWLGRRVIAATPQVVLREQPDEQAPAIPVSAACIWLHVRRTQGDWLQTVWGWMRTADAVRDDRAIEFFTAELARGESAFAYVSRSRAWSANNEFDKAQADVSEALRLEPNNARAYFARSTISAAQQRPEDQLAACDRALAIDPSDPFVLETRSQLRAAAGEYDGAIKDIDAAIESFPRIFWLRSVRGYYWELKGDYDKALADFNEAIQLDPLDLYALSQRAAIHLRRQDLDKALRDAEQALRMDPKLADALAIRGIVHVQKGELDAALADLDESIRQNATDPTAVSYRGVVHYLKGQYDAAVVDFTQAISLNADDADNYARRAETWSRKGDQASAILDLARYVRLRPNDANARAQLGLLRKTTDLKAAFEDFNAALKINPRLVRALIGRSQIWKQKNESAKAMDDANAAIDADPREADAYLQRGWLRKETDPDAAIEDFNAALELNPRNLGALLERADVWRKQNEPEKALADLTAAIEVNPNGADAYRLRAELLGGRFDHRRAIDDLAAALRINPGDIDSLLRRSTQWSLAGNLEKALEDCRAVLAKEPKNLTAYSHMANAHSMAGRREEALEDYAAALAIDPHDEQLRFDRAYELFDQGKFDLALADVEEVMRNGQRVADAHNWRGYFWMRKKNWDKALADFNEAIRLEPGDAEHWRMRADCWYGMKEFDKAIKDADEALRLAPALVAAAQVRRQAWEAKNDPSKAGDPYGGAMTYGDSEVVISAVQSEDIYQLELRGPDGLKLLHEGRTPEEFGLPSLAFPVRLPMGGEFAARFKLVGVSNDPGAALYARLNSKRLSPQEIKFLRAENPSITLTETDLAAALSSKEVTKILVLHRRKGEQTAQAAFEVLTSAELDPKTDPIAAAAGHGAVAATLLISQRVPSIFPAPPDDRPVEFRLRGPEGIMVAHESPRRGEFDGEPHPLPERLALLPGAALRVKLSGAPLTAGGPVYALVTLPPNDSFFIATTDFPITLTTSDLKAASAGKAVTRVFYQRHDDTYGYGAAPPLQSLSSADLEAGQDPIAKACEHGTILAVVLLRQRIADLPTEGFKRAPDAKAPDGTQPDDGPATTIAFCGLEGMAIRWDVTAPNKFDSEPLVVPGRYNFPSGAIYRLKLSRIPGRKDLELYMTLEVAPTLPRTAVYLKKNAVPVNFTAEDIELMSADKPLTKIVYLPDKDERADAQEGLETLVSSQLAAGLDPIIEADRRGTILAILRAGHEPTLSAKKPPASATPETDGVDSN